MLILTRLNGPFLLHGLTLIIIFLTSARSTVRFGESERG
jgi:hypothetical protein